VFSGTLNPTHSLILFGIISDVMVMLFNLFYAVT